MKQNPQNQQMTMLDEFDRKQKLTLRYEFDRKQAWMRENFERLNLHEIYPHDNPLPAGTEIIVEWPGWTPEERIETTKFYRTLLGFHITVGGIQEDLRWEPSDEFPDEPPWATFYGSDQKYTYPGFPMILWRRKA